MGFETWTEDECDHKTMNIRTHMIFHDGGIVLYCLEESLA